LQAFLEARSKPRRDYWNVTNVGDRGQTRASHQISDLLHDGRRQESILIAALSISDPSSHIYDKWSEMVGTAELPSLLQREAGFRRGHRHV
jgi:hypothetical protein